MQEHQSVQPLSWRLRTDSSASYTAQDGAMLQFYMVHFSSYYYFHPPCHTIRPLTVRVD